MQRIQLNRDSKFHATNSCITASFIKTDFYHNKDLILVFKISRSSGMYKSSLTIYSLFINELFQCVNKEILYLLP